MTPLAQAITSALLQFVWQGFAVSLIVWTVLFVLRNRAPQVRYGVCCVALFVMALLPVATAVASYDPFEHAQPGPAAVTLTIRAVWSGSVSSLTRWLNASQPWVLRFWVLGVVFLSLRLSWLGVRVSSLRRSGSTASPQITAIAVDLARRMGVTRTVRVLVSAIPDGPGLAGWVRPVILLPAAGVLNLTPEQLEAILAHEIAHMRRYDDVVNIAQSVAETLLFYHPAVWWVSNRIRQERELCCDDLAVRTCGDAMCYARALTALEKLRIGSPQVVLGALGMGDAPLEYRIRRIVGASAGDYRSSRLPGMMALLLALVCAAIYSGPVRASVPLPPSIPEYPETARDEGIEGTVPVKITVDALGRVSGAEAVGGPRELRRAAVESATAVRFAPDLNIGAKQVNVAFELSAPSAAPAPPIAIASTPLIQPLSARTGPKWIDQGESELGMSAAKEKDPARKLALLREWKRQYPNSELGHQRTLMTAEALLSVLEAAYGKPAANADVLQAGKQAGLELLNDFEAYFDDSVKPDSLPPERWVETRRASQLQIHSVFAWIAQAEKDDATAESEFRKVLEIDPEQASASYELGVTLLREISGNKEDPRLPQAIYEFARALALTGPHALAGADRDPAENALRNTYAGYHGSDEGMSDLMSQASASMFPPPGFHLLSVAEVRRNARRLRGDTRPDLDLWESVQTGIAERGDDYFHEVRAETLPPRRGQDYRGPAMFQATVVSQSSPRELLVNVDDAAGDAILRFADPIRGSVAPGTPFLFRGVVDSYREGGHIITLTVPKPRRDIGGLKLSFVRRGNFLSRLVRRVFHPGPRSAT